MSKEKNKNTFRVAALLLVACLISSVMLSGTFAKYTSEYAGQDTALVARWSFEARGGDNNTTLGAVSENTELALFDHLYNRHIIPTDGVAPAHTKYIIAPGVQDQFTIKMDYLADVDADVEIAFEKLPGSAAVPIEYCVVRDGLEDTWVTLDGLADALADRIIARSAAAYNSKIDTTQPGNGIFRILAISDDSTVSINETIKWRWSYDNRSTANWKSLYGDINTTIADADAADTALGEASGPASTNRTSYGIKVTLTATQVTPATGDEIPITAIGAITGDTQVTKPLTAGTLTVDSEGTVTASYQWQRSDSVNGAYSDISGATASTYTLAEGDQGKYIRVVATGTGSYTNTVRSAAVGPIAP
jgi:hypothetical protein